MTLKRDQHCTLCKLHKTAQFVCLLGIGPKQCDIMVVGEAPGRREDDSGKAFVNTKGAGGVLDQMLESIGLDREDIFITNAVSCRPPENRTPSKAEVAACKVWLDRQIKAVKPKYVLLLGNTPLLSVTGETGIKKARGRPFEKNGIVYLPTYHPAATLYDPRTKFHLERDFQLFKEIVEGGGIPRERNLNYRIVMNLKDFREMCDDLKQNSTASYDIETNQLYAFPTIDDKGKWVLPKINTIGFGTKKYQWILPISHPESPFNKKQIQAMMEELDEIVQGLLLVMQGGKFDCLWTWVQLGVQWQDHLDFDTMLAHYILDENDNHDLKYLGKKYLGAPDWDVDKDTKQGKKGLAKLAFYQAHDLYYTRALKPIFAKMLHKDGEVKRIFDEIIMPCARMFVEVEYDGVCIDTTKMAAAEKHLRKKLRIAQEAMQEWGDINWGSTKQLANLLFGPKKKGGLGLEVIEKTKKGAASTSESVIKRIDHPIAKDILDFRGAKQQLSFFIEGWKPFLHKKHDGWYLHPSFKIHGTVTGRLSCEHPNLQQVPRDVRIRELIGAPAGWTLLEADLSQIELRIAAELAQEPTMLDAFHRGIDVHWLTAMGELKRGGGGKHVDTIIRTAEAYLKKESKPRKLKFAEAMDIVAEKIAPAVAEELQKEWGEKDPELLWKEIRKKAKAVNFGYLYGMWWKKFKVYARDNYGVTLSDHQAEESRKFFFSTFPAFKKWHERQKRYARLNGYVRSLSGRKRRLPDAMSSVDGFARQEAERQAINSPVQSFANELNLMSALQLRKEFGRDIVRICGTVHDSILLRIKNEYVEKVGSRLLEIMSHPELMDKFEIEVGVPILAEAKVGPWGTGIDFHKWKKQREANDNMKARRRRAA